MSKEPKKNQDISVEEILKSIKGVIDNRDTIATNDDDILELTNIANNEDSDRLGAVNKNNHQDDCSSQEPLVSDKSATETTNILENFSKVAKGITVHAENSKAKTLEGIVIEIIRPQLSQWLDKNLPSLVQQLVEKEIQRLIPKDKRSKID